MVYKPELQEPEVDASQVVILHQLLHTSELHPATTEMRLLQEILPLLVTTPLTLPFQ